MGLVPLASWGDGGPCHTFLFFLINRWNTNHPLPAQTLCEPFCCEQDAKTSCVTSKAALHPHPKSSAPALSTTRTGSVSSVTTGPRARGAGGKREETQPQVTFPVPSSALALISAGAVGENIHLLHITRSRMKDICNSALAKTPNC